MTWKQLEHFKDFKSFLYTHGNSFKLRSSMFKSRPIKYCQKKSKKNLYPMQYMGHISTHFNKGHVQFNATADFPGLRNGPAEKFNKVYFLIISSSVKPLLNTWGTNSSFVWFLHNFREAKANCITCKQIVLQGCLN